MLDRSLRDQTTRCRATAPRGCPSWPCSTPTTRPGCTASGKPTGPGTGPRSCAARRPCRRFSPITAVPHCPTHEVGYHQFWFDPALAAQVREVARTADATPFMVLLARLALAVHRRTGRTDLIVGTPVSMRNRAELRDLIGFFINLLPLRFRVDGHPSVRDLLIHVREVALGGYQNQDVPFEQIADLSRRNCSGGRHPLLQLVFEMHIADPHPAPFGGAALTRRLHVSLSCPGSTFPGRSRTTGSGSAAASSTTGTCSTPPRSPASAPTGWPCWPPRSPTPTRPWTWPPKPRTGSGGPAGACGRRTHADMLFERQVRRSPDAVALVSGSAEINVRGVERTGEPGGPAAA